MSVNLTLVLGGVASGKSAFAEKLVRETGRNRIYIATAQAFDAEMTAKIARHQEMRGEGWTTIEAPVELAPHFEAAIKGDVILLDCATLWLSNVMLAELDIATQSQSLLAVLSRCAAEVIIVSNEVGGGGIAETSLARKFANAQGVLNQQLAQQADAVYAVMAGMPLALKGPNAAEIL